MKQIINPDVIVNIATESQTLTLKESGADSKIKKLHIQNIPQNTFAFTLDYQPSGPENRMFKQLSCYVDISNKNAINKGCDLVLLIPQIKHYTVLLFELKSKKPKQVATEKQLLNSELYVRYLMTLVKHHYGVDVTSLVSPKFF